MPDGEDDLPAVPGVSGVLWVVEQYANQPVKRHRSPARRNDANDLINRPLLTAA